MTAPIFALHVYREGGDHLRWSGWVATISLVSARGRLLHKPATRNPEPVEQSEIPTPRDNP